MGCVTEPALPYAFFQALVGSPSTYPSQKSLKTRPGLARKKQTEVIILPTQTTHNYRATPQNYRTITNHYHTFALFDLQKKKCHFMTPEERPRRICWRRKVAEINPPASLENQSLLGNPVAIHSWASRNRTRGEQLRFVKKETVFPWYMDHVFFPLASPKSLKIRLAWYIGQVRVWWLICWDPSWIVGGQHICPPSS